MMQPGGTRAFASGGIFLTVSLGKASSTLGEKGRIWVTKSRHAMKTLSVIIPARNEESVIVRTVAAAVASAHALVGKSVHLDETEVEILVVDNASTDRTREVLEPWVRTFGVRVLDCPVPRAPCARNY